MVVWLVEHIVHYKDHTSNWMYVLEDSPTMKGELDRIHDEVGMNEDLVISREEIISLDDLKIRLIADLI